jgi:23S rRNA (guanosine2251-2'-O)-methyltransferase
VPDQRGVEPYDEGSAAGVADALGPGEELVAGRHPVEEAFAAGRPAIRLLVTPARRAALERIVLHATRLRIPIAEVDGGTLTAIAGFDGHQGVALVVEPRRPASVDDVLARAAALGEAPFVLVMDSLEDPQNVGTLLRTAEASGVHGILFPTHRQAPLTPAAVKASAGAVEHLLLAPVGDLPGAVADLHVRGVRVVGAESTAPLTARQADLRGPLALVVGSEGRGLGPAVRRRCDLLVRIPMRGRVGSLNAAVAGSILVYEALAQRDPDGTGSPPRDTPTPDRASGEVEPEAKEEVEAEAQAVEAEAQAVEAEPGAMEAEPRPTVAEPEAVATDPEGAAVDLGSGTGETEPRPAGAKATSKPTTSRTTATKAKAKPAKAKATATKAKATATKAKAKSAKPKTASAKAAAPAATAIATKQPSTARSREAPNPVLPAEGDDGLVLPNEPLPRRSSSRKRPTA